MSIYTYDYSISGNFSGPINLDQLHYIVKNSSSITQPFDGIVTGGDTLTFRFTAELTSGEQTSLDSIVSSYTQITQLDYSNYNVITLVPPTNTISIGGVYTKILSFHYMGTYTTGISNIKLLSYMDSGVTSYDVKIFDISNGYVISTANFTNTSSQLNSMGTINHVPTSPATFDIYIKKNGSGSTTKIYITNILFFVK